MHFKIKTCHSRFVKIILGSRNSDIAVFNSGRKIINAEINLVGDFN